MPLTAVAIKNAKGGPKPYKMSDGGGLHLLVKPDGRRYWRLNYRFAGKHKTLALGVFPEVSLAEAREKRDEAKKQIADGRDPSVERKVKKLTGGTSSQTTFKAIAEELLAKLEQEGRTEATLSKMRWLLSFAHPIIGDRPIDEIKAPELLAVLRTLEVRERYESARRLRGVCGQVFR